MADEAKKPTTTYDVASERTITLTPLPDNGNGFARERDINMQFLKKTLSKDGADRVTGTWNAVAAIVIDGMEDTVQAKSTDHRKALAGLLKQLPGKTTMDDYEDPFDEEDDFWKQKISAPKPPAFKMDEEVDGQTLLEWASEIETDLQAAENAPEDEFYATVRASDKTRNLFVTRFKSNIASMREFVNATADAMGNKKGLFAKLGKGTNSLKEFMRLAEMSERERSALIFRGPKSGKGIDLNNRKALTRVVETAVERFVTDYSKDEEGNPVSPLPNWVGTGDKAEPGFDIVNAVGMLRAIAKDRTTFNIIGADDMSIDELSDAMDAAADEALEKFVEQGLRHASTYDDEAFAEHMRVFGMVLITGGADDDESEVNVSHGVRRTISLLREIEAAEERKDDKAMDAKYAALHSTHKNPMMAICARMARASIERRKDDIERRKLVEQLKGDEVEPLVNKQVAKSSRTMDLEEYALKLARTVADARSGDGTKNDALEVMKRAVDLLRPIVEANEAAAKKKAA